MEFQFPKYAGGNYSADELGKFFLFSTVSEGVLFFGWSEREREEETEEQDNILNNFVNLYLF